MNHKQFKQEMKEAMTNKPTQETRPMSDAAEVSKHLKTIAGEIDKRLTGLVGHKVAFSLFVWTDGRSNYISTASRSEVAQVLVQHLKGWAAGMPDIAAHIVE